MLVGSLARASPFRISHISVSYALTLGKKKRLGGTPKCSFGLPSVWHATNTPMFTRPECLCCTRSERLDHVAKHTQHMSGCVVACEAESSQNTEKDVKTLACGGLRAEEEAHRGRGKM